MDHLTIGIVALGPTIPQWQAYALERIAALDFVHVKSVFVVDRGDHGREQFPGFSSLSWLLRMHAKFDSKLFRYWCKPNACTANKLDGLDFLPTADSVSAERPGYPLRLASQDHEALMSAEMDVLIDLGAWLDPVHACAAKYGIWRVVHHPTQDALSVVPGFWECLDRNPVMGSRLEIIEDEFASPLIVDTLLSTPRYESPCVNRNYLFWASATLWARGLARLYELGSREYFDARHMRLPPVLPEFRTYGRGQTFLGSVGYCMRYFVNNFREYLDRKRNWEQWYLLFSLNPDTELNIGDFQAIDPPEDEFWADPHIIKRGDIYYVFVEVYTMKTGKGHISVLEIHENGSVSEPVKVLEKDYHLSYPLIVEEDGAIYMLPETKGNKKIELYRCVEFPTKWELEMVLIDEILATDATPFWHEGKWWLFAAVVDSEYSQCREELHLFYAEKLLTKEWTRHPANPIVSDVRLARPAGRIFLRDGKIIRPSQDCSYRYGYGLVFNEIIKLTTEEYEEKRLSHVAPDWAADSLGVHSYSKESSLTVIDALRTRRRPTRRA